MEHVLTAIIALISGALGSLLAPWIHWDIERKRENLKEKLKLIEEIRTHILKDDIRTEKFLNSLNFIKIRPFLDNKFVQTLEDLNVTEITTNQYRSTYQMKFLSEIDRIEKDWGLQLSDKKKFKNEFKRTNSGHSDSLTIQERVEAPRK